MATCLTCSHPIQPGDATCASCGLPTVYSVAPSDACASCGAQLEADAAFCETCGGRVERSVPSSQELAAPTLKPNLEPLCGDCQTVLEPGWKFCETCGARVVQCGQCSVPSTGGSKFCEHCGASMLQVSQPLAAPDAAESTSIASTNSHERGPDLRAAERKSMASAADLRADVTSQPFVVPPAQESGLRSATCTGCGRPRPSAGQFCGFCGTTVVPETALPAAITETPVVARTTSVLELPDVVLLGLHAREADTTDETQLETIGQHSLPMSPPVPEQELDRVEAFVPPEVNVEGLETDESLAVDEVLDIDLSIADNAAPELATAAPNDGVVESAQPSDYEEMPPDPAAQPDGVSDVRGVEAGPTARVPARGWPAPATDDPHSSTDVRTGPTRGWIVAGLAGVFALVVVGLAAALGSWVESDSAKSAPVDTGKKSGSPDVPTGMVYVPGGTFEMGSTVAGENAGPPHTVTVEPFFIDVHEVSCARYLEFVKATGHRPPPSWRDGRFPEGNASRPVTDVDWDDAVAFCAWAGYRLCTEKEWEFAARGTDGRTYPWGSEWKADGGNFGAGTSKGLTSVGTFPAGASPFGVLDMAGNAFEWTSTEFRAYPGGTLPDDWTESMAVEGWEFKVVRGGCWGAGASEVTTTVRVGLLARSTKGAKRDYEQTGFRCARDIGKAR